VSLINEALKKARVEAAQRDAERRGVLVPKAAALEPRRRGGSAVTWALAVVAALGLAATGGMWLARRGAVPVDPPEAAAMDGGEARGAGAGAGAPEGGDGGPETAAVPEAVAPEAVAPETGSARAAAPVAIDPPPAVADAPRPAPADPDPAPPEGTDPAPAAGTAAGSEALPPPARPSASADPPAPAPRKRPAAAPTAAEGYLREAPLPAGGSIRLDGIVWSEATPAAVIEGQIVGPGEYVRGARIVRVERQRVVLEADGVELVIRLR
jgi:hypothetical protein